MRTFKGLTKLGNSKAAIFIPLLAIAQQKYPLGTKIITEYDRPFYNGLPDMLNLLSALDLSCFSASYFDAWQRFTRSHQRVAPRLVRSLHSYAHPLLGPQHEALGCDVLHLGQSDTPQQLLVLISGTHGVEGFAGSAIQSDCLPLLEDVLQKHPTLGIVMIHAFNPWGFAWLRRCDHEGIDLNRNFVDFDSPLPDNTDYEPLHSRILDYAGADTALTAAKLPSLWRDSDLVTFTEAVTRGQYHHRDGLFYGGNAPSWSRRMLEQVTATPVFAAAQRIAVIDLHTGLGPYGYGEVINDHPERSAGFDLAGSWYGDNAQSTVLGESVSSLKQGLLDYHWHRVIGERGCFVTLEFGTYASSRLLTALINEQVLHNHVSQTGEARDINEGHIQRLKHFFYPAETSWEQQVLFRGRQTISLALEGIMR
jgi:hypothetical protein